MFENVLHNIDLKIGFNEIFVDHIKLKSKKMEACRTKSKKMEACRTKSKKSEHSKMKERYKNATWIEIKIFMSETKVHFDKTIIYSKKTIKKL